MIDLWLHFNALKRYSHLKGNRAAKKEYNFIFTETEVDIKDSSYEDDIPEQDEEDKEVLFQDSLFKDKLSAETVITSSLRKFALVKSVMDCNCMLEPLDLATTGGAIGIRIPENLYVAL